MKYGKNVLLVFCLWGIPSQAIDLFGKGSVSRNYLDVDKYTISVSLSGGIAFSLLPWVRLEGRYANTTNLQNRMDVVSGTVLGTLSNIRTETQIASVGLDFDFLGDRSPVQPYIYAGIGYIKTDRSYYFTLAGATDASFYTEPTRTGVSVNGGLGLRLRLSKQISLEVEAFGYAQDAQNPNPLINVYGTAGLRIYI